MKHFLKCLFAGLAMAAMMLGMSGCEQEGPAEQAGEQIDESVEEGQEQLQDTGEEVGE